MAPSFFDGEQIVRCEFHGFIGTALNPSYSYDEIRKVSGENIPNAPGQKLEKIGNLRDTSKILILYFE